MREALANALIHSDYYGRQGIVVEKTKNKIKISNPGICRIPIKEIEEGGISDPRNPVIFKMFSLIDIGERAGSGFSNILTVWQDNNWEKPSISEKFEPERTITVFPVEFEEEGESDTNDTNDDTNDTNNDTNDDTNDTNNDTNDDTNDTNNTNNDTNDDTNRVSQVLLLIVENNKISTNEIAGILNASIITIKREIAKLKKDGVIERINGTRGYWKINK